MESGGDPSCGTRVTTKKKRTTRTWVHPPSLPPCSPRTHTPTTRVELKGTHFVRENERKRVDTEGRKR